MAGCRIAGLFGSGRKEPGDKPARIEDLYPRLLGRIDVEGAAGPARVVDLPFPRS